MILTLFYSDLLPEYQSEFPKKITIKCFSKSANSAAKHADRVEAIFQKGIYVLKDIRKSSGTESWRK